MKVNTETSPAPLVLVPVGEREVVDKARAIEIVTLWKDELLTHRAMVGDCVTLCNSINLSNKSYTHEAAIEIASFLTSTEVFNPSIASGITFADLSDVIASRMETEGLQVLTTLSDAFKCSKVVELDLSDNAMGSKGITACATLLGGSASIDSLECLSLCNNGLSGASMEEIAEILTSTNVRESGDGSALSSSCIASRLKKIHFFNNMSGDSGCESFAKIIQRCDNLRDMRFSSTRANEKGSAIFIKALENLASSSDKLQNLTRLDLADNTFGKCGSILAKTLTSCSNLKYLNIKDCLLDDAGVRSVCSALIESGCSLTHLDLSGNEISQEVIKDVIALLQNAVIGDSIRHLVMEDCEMTSIGVRRIARVLTSTKSGINLQEVNFEGNECGRIGATALLGLAVTGVLPSLKCIRLDRNMFPSESVDALVTAFGTKLVNMEENDDEDDVDEDMDEEEQSDDDIVDNLADGLEKVSI